MYDEIIIGIILTITGLVAGQFMATAKAKRKDITTNTLNSIEMKTDIKYIIKTIDEIKPIPARVTVLEEITKQILIEIENIKRGNC
jgi:hypothetical protein